jgi:hypothetical protein
MLVDGQWDCLVVQEKEQIPRKVNGYSGVVQMAEVAVILQQDKMRQLKKKVLVHRYFKKRDTYLDTYLADSGGRYRYLEGWATAECTVHSVEDSGRGRWSGIDLTDNLGLGIGGS